MADGVGRNAEAGVLDRDAHIVLRALQRHMDAAARVIVFDAVFDQVEQDLIDVVLDGKHGAAALPASGEVDPPVVRQRHQHPEHARDHIRHINDLMLLRALLTAREHEQLLRHAVEAFCLAADVRDELTHRARVHLILQDGVGQELDRRQRRFQLMRRIGDKLPLRGLGFLQARSELVKFLGEGRKFVRAVHLYRVGILALTRKTHRREDGAHSAGAHD